MTEEQRKELLERLRKEKAAKEARAKVDTEKQQQEKGVPSDVWGKYGRKQAEGRPFLEVLKERLFEPYPSQKRPKK